MNLGDSANNTLIAQLNAAILDQMPRRPAEAKVMRVGLQAVQVKLTETGTILRDVPVIGGVTGLIEGSTVFLLYANDHKVLALNLTDSGRELERKVEQQFQPSSGSGAAIIVNGIFTPTFIDSDAEGVATYVTQVGAYSRFGKMVWFWGHIKISAIDTTYSATGRVGIHTTLPAGPFFPHETPAHMVGSATINRLSNFVYSSDVKDMWLETGALDGQVVLWFNETFNDAGDQRAPSSNFYNDQCEVIFSGFYDPDSEVVDSGGGGGGGGGTSPGDLVWEVDSGIAGLPFDAKVIDGNLYICGVQNVPIYNRTATLEKRSISDGSLIWVRQPTIGSSASVYNSLDGDASNIYTSGSYIGGGYFMHKTPTTGATGTVATPGKHYLGPALMGSDLFDVGAGAIGTSNGIWKRPTSTMIAASSVHTTGSYESSVIKADIVNSRLLTIETGLIERWSNTLTFVDSEALTSYQPKLSITSTPEFYVSDHAGYASPTGKGLLKKLEISDMSLDWSVTSADDLYPTGTLDLPYYGEIGLAIGPDRAYISGGNLCRLVGIDLGDQSETFSVTGSTNTDDRCKAICYDDGFVYLAIEKGGYWMIQKRYA